MEYTVIAVERVLDTETGNERVNFEFGSEVDCILNTKVFMTTDKAKALKSTSVWTRSLLPEVKFPNVKGLMKFKNLEEDEATEQVLEKHIQALESLVGKTIKMYSETVYINGQSYFNWLPYEPRKVEEKEELATDDSILKEGF
jgi:hypothetical protein